MRHAFALLSALALLLPSLQARAEPVALTFDDLPALALTHSVDYWRETTSELLNGLRRHHYPAIGFVTESKLEGDDRQARIALLEAWLAAGMDLGNHGYSHESLTKTPMDAYIADVSRGETVTRELLATRGRTERWFRYPYLETGPTPEARAKFDAWLAEHGYEVAPVTMENSDWMFALVYDDAVLRKDMAGAARIRQAYLDYTARVVPWYRQAALELLGRRPAFVFLLHASRLNADSIDDLAQILRTTDLEVITLDKAMTDPAYKTPDTYVGPDGDEWLTRWSLTLHKDLPWSTFPQPPADIAAEDHRLDSAPVAPPAPETVSRPAS